jgi:hypothetical protein
VNRAEGTPALETRDFMLYPPAVEPVDAAAEHKKKVAALDEKIRRNFDTHNARLKG